MVYSIPFTEVLWKFDDEWKVLRSVHERVRTVEILCDYVSRDDMMDLSNQNFVSAVLQNRNPHLGPSQAQFLLSAWFFQPSACSGQLSAVQPSLRSNPCPGACLQNPSTASSHILLRSLILHHFSDSPNSSYWGGEGLSSPEVTPFQ